MGNKKSRQTPPEASVENRRRSMTPPPLDMVTLRRKSEELERQIQQDMIATRRYEVLRRSSSRKDVRRSCGTATPSPHTPNTPRSFSSVQKSDPDSAVVELMFALMAVLKTDDITIQRTEITSHDGKKPAHPFLYCVNEQRYYPVTIEKSAAFNKYQASVTI